MANEVATKDTFSTMLTTELENNREALPEGFNMQRFVQNGLALLNGNDNLKEFAQKYGTAQIKQGMMRGAFLNLDFLNNEAYLVPYGKTLNFMQSYKGYVKMVKRYSTRPIKDIYAKLVRQGDEFSEGVVNGEPTVNFKPLPFNDGPIIGAFAVCLYQDGGMVYDTMSLKDLENTRSASKAKNSPAWSKFTGQMYLKTVLHRLCKHLSIDMDAQAKQAFDEGTEIETDVQEIAKREIEENQNSIDFEVEAEEFVE